MVAIEQNGAACVIYESGSELVDLLEISNSSLHIGLWLIKRNQKKINLKFRYEILHSFCYNTHTIILPSTTTQRRH